MERLLLALLALSACAAADQACTEIGCENSASVSYGMLISAPYDLSIVGEGDMLTARCNDPDALETEQNPPNLVCTSSGFSIDGGAVSDATAMFVTVVDVATGDAIFANAEVILGVVGEHQPNGPGCDPICTERAGTVSTSP